MPRKNSYPTFTDQFCGAGGSSQGAIKAGGEAKVALNHWKLAVETYSTNIPDALVDCTDVSACDPRRYPSTDFLITSPECTNHSIAQGKKLVKKQLELYQTLKLDPAAERSRATMWDVPRFAEYHNYNGIIVENVVDARKWVMFDAWLMAMTSLGYKHRCVYANSMFFHPTPQSRDRMYVIFWKKGNKAPNLDYTPLAYCDHCGRNIVAVQTWKRVDKKYGKYKQQYIYCCPVHGKPVTPYYYASFNCIDWSDIGQRIGDRATPLKPSTISRIEYGLKKYETEPIIFHAGYGKEARGVVRSVIDPAFTQTTIPTQAIVKHQPFIIKAEHTSQKNVRGVNDAFQTQTTRQSESMVIPPLLTTLRKNGNAFPATNVLKTVTAGGINAGMVTTESWNCFLSSYYNGSHCTKHITEETGTIPTVDRFSLTQYCQPQIEDCYYRMLKAGEIKLAMAFDREYKVIGNSRDQVKQLGNAVTPPVMEWLSKQLIESLQ